MSVPNNHQEEPLSGARSRRPHPHAYPRLASLRERLAAFGCETRLDMSSLIVIAPERGEDGSARLADTITCTERRDDANRLWFRTSWGEWIEEAEHIVDAAMKIAVSLRVRTDSAEGA